MLNSVLIGILGAGAVAAPMLFRAPLEARMGMSLLFGASLLVAAVLRTRSRYYDGMADLMIHIHSPAHQDPPRRWLSRGFVSFLLNLGGGMSGIEGAAIEGLQGFALRTRSWSGRWSEQRRRTDAACALSAGIAAAFGAPFAAVLVPMELGVGGHGLSTVVSALSAFLASRFLVHLGWVKSLDLSSAIFDFSLSSLSHWTSILVIGGISGVYGAALVRFIRFSRESLKALVPRHARWRVVAPVALLLLIAWILPSGHFAPRVGFEELVWYPKTAPEIALALLSQTLSFVLILAGFGTVGIFWPLFTLGALLGYGGILLAVPGVPAFAVVAALAGASGVWGAVLGAPLSAALVAFDLTHNFQVLIPCFLAASIARSIRDRLVIGTLIDRDLEARGMALHRGRSQAILSGIPVSEAMVTDFEAVSDHEPIAELYPRIFGSRYQFLPVVNSQGAYQGLLTTDMIQDAWEKQLQVDESSKPSPLVSLFEAKDLLYRAGFKPPTVRPEDPLSRAAGLFEDMPCLPVIGEQSRMVGLLFIHNVRLAYDREVMRRSLKRDSAGGA